MAPDVFLHADLAFPESLPQFQRLFPDDAACARYLESIRWRDGFACPRCGVTAEPFRFAGIQATRWSLDREDKTGRRNGWLRTLDRLGIGFDS